MAGRLTALATVICTLLAVACVGVGLGLLNGYADDARNKTRAALDALSVYKSEVPGYDELPKAVLATVITVSVVAGISAILLIVRACMSMRMASRGKLPRAGSLLNNVLSFLLMVANWILMVWLILFLMGMTLYLGVCFAYDKGATGLVNSDLNQKWQTVNNVYAGAAQLTGAITPLLEAVRNLPDAIVPDNLEDQIDPALAAVQDVLPQPGEVCAKTCLDLQSVSIFNSTTPQQRCLCDLSRIQAAQGPLDSAWKNDISKMMLGLGLAWVGVSWLALLLSASVARTRAERTYEKYAAAELAHQGYKHEYGAAPPLTSGSAGAPAVVVHPGDRNGINGYAGPIAAEPSAPVAINGNAPHYHPRY